MLRVITLILILLSTSSVWAEPSRILVWGIRRGCEYNEEVTKEVQKHLLGLRKVELISPKLARSGCQGAECAALLTRACPGVEGLLLGGIVEPGQNVSKVRIWYHDLQSGQTAYLDDYCQGCDLVSSVNRTAAFITDHARFEDPAPGVTPIYCTQAATQPRLDSRPVSNKLFVSVTGKGTHHAALWPAIRQHLKELAYDVIQIHPEDPSFPHGELRKIVAKDPGSKVLMVEMQSVGKVELNLFDENTSRTQASMVDCPDCEKEELVQKVKGGISLLLNFCFTEDCVRATNMPPPPEACKPFAELRCGGEPIPLVASSGQSAAASKRGTEIGIDPNLAKLTKGILWGLFAASAATSAALFAVNATSAGELHLRGYDVDHLLPAAGVAAGFSILTLGLAIPTTVVIDRASAKNQGAEPPKRQPQALHTLGLQCPN